MRKKFITILLSLSMILMAIPMATVTANAAADVTSGLVAKFAFDGNTNESVNSIATTRAQNITYEKGIFGQAAVFNGTTSYIETAANSALLTGSNFTFSAWINNGDAEGRNGTFVQMGRKCGWDYNDVECFSAPYRIINDWGREVDFYFNNYYATGEGTVTDGYFDESGAQVNGHKWQLLTVTYDGGVVKQYLDDKLVYQKSYTDGVTNHNPYGLLIGVNEELDAFYKGMMDDLRIYNRAITEAEVGTLYSAGVASNKEALNPAKALVAHYSFENNLTDAVKGNNGSAESSVDYVSGPKGKALRLSDDNYVEIPASDLWNMGASGTIAFWAKLSKNDNKSKPVITVSNPTMGGNSHNSDFNSLDIGLRPWNSEVELYTDGYALNYDSLTNYDQSLGSGDRKTSKVTGWHHYTVVFTQSKGELAVKYYIDGQFRKTVKIDDYLELVNASGVIRIGYDGDTRFFDGSIDEVRVYNYPLTTANIQSLVKADVKLSLSSANQKNLTVAKGKSKTITEVNVKIGNSTSKIKSAKSDVTFKSSDTKVFKVTGAGRITGRKKGSAKLTITYGGVTRAYTVKVK